LNILGDERFLKVSTKEWVMKERRKEKEETKKSYEKPALTRRGKLTDVGVATSKDLLPDE